MINVVSFQTILGLGFNNTILLPRFIITVLLPACVAPSVIYILRECISVAPNVIYILHVMLSSSFGQVWGILQLIFYFYNFST